MKFGLDDLTKQMMFERGELDLMDRIPSASYVRLKKDPRWQPYFEKLVFNGDYYLNLNCEMAPFDGANGKKVRQAFNYAIDKDRIVQVANGRYIAAKGVVPPNMPGYKSQVVGLFLRPGKGETNSSRRPATPTAWSTLGPLAVQRGQRRRAHRGGDPAGPQGGRRQERGTQRRQLRRVPAGRRASARPWPFRFPAGIQDYPDPSDFLDVLFSTKSITDAESNNMSFYSSDKADELMDAGDKETDPAKRMDDLRGGGESDRGRDAPVVPLRGLAWKSGCTSRG